MIADVIVTVPTIEEAQKIVVGYLAGEGWVIDKLDHGEMMSTAPIHDSRLGALFRSAQKKGLAAELS